MTRLEEIDSKQKELLGSISEIETMVQGTINTVSNTYKLKDGTKVKGKPHFTVTKKNEEGKTITYGIDKGSVERYQEESENHRRFKELTLAYAMLAEEKFNLLQLGSETEGYSKKTKD